MSRLLFWLGNTGSTWATVFCGTEALQRDAAGEVNGKPSVDDDSDEFGIDRAVSRCLAVASSQLQGSMRV